MIFVSTRREGDTEAKDMCAIPLRDIMSRGGFFEGLEALRDKLGNTMKADDVFLQADVPCNILLDLIVINELVLV